MFYLKVNNEAERNLLEHKLIGFFEQNNITYDFTQCYNCDKICFAFSVDGKTPISYCYDFQLTVVTCKKEIYRIYPKDILYIAIENRKSVLYLTYGRIETSELLKYWIGVLNPRIFVQPHSSYIVNLNYVESVTKDYVKIRYMDTSFYVYTSFRKIKTFKKALVEFGEYQLAKVTEK